MKTPAGSPELLSTDTVKERKNGGKDSSGEKKNEEGEKQISTNLSLGADLETAVTIEEEGTFLKHTRLSHAEVWASRE